MGTLVTKKIYKSEKKYGHWIAKTKCTLKEIATIYFVSVAKIWKCIPKEDQSLIKGLKIHESLILSIMVRPHFMLNECYLDVRGT